MTVRTATAEHWPPRSRSSSTRARGSAARAARRATATSSALDALIRRYTGFVRLKASSYFLAGGDSDDLIQEG